MHEMAANMGVPPDKLLSVLYKKEVAKRAKAEVEATLNSETPKEDDEATVIRDPTSPVSPGGKRSGLSGDKIEVGQPKKPAGDLAAGSPKLQRDLSVKTMFSNATADTMEGSLMAPPFKFGT